MQSPNDIPAFATWAFKWVRGGYTVFVWYDRRSGRIWGRPGLKDNRLFNNRDVHVVGKVQLIELSLPLEHRSIETIAENIEGAISLELKFNPVTGRRK